MKMIRLDDNGIGDRGPQVGMRHGLLSLLGLFIARSKIPAALSGVLGSG